MDLSPGLDWVVRVLSRHPGLLQRIRESKRTLNIFSQWVVSTNPYIMMCIQQHIPFKLHGGLKFSVFHGPFKTLFSWGLIPKAIFIFLLFILKHIFLMMMQMLTKNSDADDTSILGDKRMEINPPSIVAVFELKCKHFCHFVRPECNDWCLSVMPAKANMYLREG